MRPVRPNLVYQVLIIYVWNVMYGQGPMSIIVEFQVPSAAFELGRILDIEDISVIELESLVPVGESTVPLFWIHDSTRDSFVSSVQEHPAVNDTSTVDQFDDRVLFTLDWDADRDHIFAGIGQHDGQLLSAVGTPRCWEFEIRFRSHDDLSAFMDHCEDADIAVDITRMYHPTEGGTGPWYGLTDRQRETLILAVEAGYYDIPRGCTTKDLADQIGISDQAVTERLRRAIASLTTSALITPSE
jgi:predicted DNA binding protein